MMDKVLYYYIKVHHLFTGDRECEQSNAQMGTHLIDRCEEGQDDAGEEHRLSVPQRDTSLEAKLGKRSNSADRLANEGSSETQLRNATNEELVLLREAEASHAKELWAHQSKRRRRVAIRIY